MVLFSRLFGPRRRKHREEIALRAAEVIAQVLSDMGIDRFMNGSVLLDREFRLRFVSVVPPASNLLLAAVQLGDLPEATIVRAAVPETGLDRATATRHAAFLADGVMRELLAASPALRALPLRRD